MSTYTTYEEQLQVVPIWSEEKRWWEAKCTDKEAELNSRSERSSDIVLMKC